jgi:hypothetical protein
MGHKRGQRDKSEGQKGGKVIAQCPLWSLGGHIRHLIGLELKPAQIYCKPNCECQFCIFVCILKMRSPKMFTVVPHAQLGTWLVECRVYRET